MTDFVCGSVRELIPDFVGSRLGAEDLALVDTHITECADCRAELELAQMILASRPPAPPALLGRIRRAVSADRRAPSRPWWGISAAAVAALALGIGISSERTLPVVEVPAYAQEVEEGDVWMSEDGLVAGAPLLEELSDEALVALLDELTLDQAGGAA